MNFRQLKAALYPLLDTENILEDLEEIVALGSKVLNPLFSFLLHLQPRIRWHAVTALGLVVAKLAEQDVEKGRVVMRRLIWMLNDESGGIGWGAPESMGEIMCHVRILANEFSNLLFSYLVADPGGKDNFLEYLPLRQGAFWGSARFAQARPDLAVKGLDRIKAAWKKEADPYILAYCLLFMSQVKDYSALCGLQRMFEKEHIITVYWQNQFVQTNLYDLQQACLPRQCSQTLISNI